MGVFFLGGGTSKLLTQGRLHRVALYNIVTLVQTFHFFLFSIFSRQHMCTLLMLWHKCFSLVRGVILVTIC